MAEINKESITGTWRHYKTTYTSGKEYETKRGTEYNLYENGTMSCFVYTDNSTVRDNTLQRWSLTDVNEGTGTLCFNESPRFRILKLEDKEMQLEDHNGIHYWKKGY
jgi:hypothetical protein